MKTVKDNVKGFVIHIDKENYFRSAKRYFWKKRICNEWFTQVIAKAGNRIHAIPLQSVSKIKRFFSFDYVLKQMINGSACAIE